jgi:ABC-type multidrug transport system permease subunit
MAPKGTAFVWEAHVKMNVGAIDRVVRVILGLILLAFAFGYVLPAGIVAHWIGGIVGVIALVTGVVGNCPLYSLLGVSTGAMKT